MRLPRPRLAIPLKLALVSSMLLLIPWVGYRYVGELERLLLGVQEQSLVSTARAVATALNDRPNVLLSGEVYPVTASPELDLRVLNLEQPIALDGRTGDWEQTGVEPQRESASRLSPRPFSLVHRLGRHGADVYALFEVEDERVVLRDPERPDLGASDHLQIAVVTGDDEFLRFAVDAQADGPASVWRLLDDGSRVSDSRIAGVWRSTVAGYLVELRLPRALIGSRLSFAVVDVDDPETRTLVGRLGTGGTAARDQLGTVLVPSPEISKLILGLGRASSRIWVLDVNRRVLAHAGTLRAPAAEPAGRKSPWDSVTDAWVRLLTRRLLDEPREDFEDMAPGTYRLEGREIDGALAGREATRWRRTPDSRAVVLSAAHPVFVADQVRGVVLVEETTNDVLAVRNREFGKLFAAILLVSLLGAVALLLFASRLSWRILRLRDGAERAIDRHGRVSGAPVGGTEARDEIGDLARSFAGILERQRQHTAYLEQVGSRLSHELRTPVAVVRSSLDNLRLQPLPAEARVYVDRADEGVRRLATILSRMSEAARLEPGLAATEREPFDLAPVVRGCVSGYRLANPGREILLREPGDAVPLLGAPDLMAQLLDKLVENALGFARPATPVRVGLERNGRVAVLAVENQGPPLPEQMRGRLFESMVSVRTAGGDGGPHLGLGLYIVQSIAKFHGGEAAAHDLPGGDGVVVTVTLALDVGSVSEGTPRDAAARL